MGAYGARLSGHKAVLKVEIDMVALAAVLTTLGVMQHLEQMEKLGRAANG
jgi:hypothetical protein